ncbi:auxin-binding 1 [Chlorella sorokiniana]|uniref:Auxin-binding 1 n=1 Tax=Chlorella sorokiniana TaxID=3076 RepID=A0A2P6TEN9_CHLSO|nr:auxin-binding 1 [Chlorella sorokiniana]|eukprot:PRW21114.1 auxin-binding 1 [Chlorella sorokiniana]
MRALLLALAAFLGGVLLGASSYRARLVLADLRAALPGPLAPVWAPHCANIYAGGQLTPVFDAGQLPPAQHPVPGLTHLTLHGRKAHGMKGLELWISTLAPGTGTPIHRHDCEEVLLVLRGEGVAAMQDKDGTVVETKLGPNSTLAVLPNARHQLRNDGSRDLHFIAAIDNPPFRPCLYRSWEDPYLACQSVWPMVWDRSCPDKAPQPLPHHVVLSGSKGATAEM